VNRFLTRIVSAATFLSALALTPAVDCMAQAPGVDKIRRDEDVAVFLQEIHGLVDAGNYLEATKRIEQWPFDSSSGIQQSWDQLFQSLLQGKQQDSEHISRMIQSTTIAYAMTGQVESAWKMTELGLDRVARLRHIADVRTMNLLFPGQPAIEQSLTKTADLSQPFAHANGFSSQFDRLTWPSDKDEAADLRSYVKYCSQCHGLRGEGNGPASRSLHPSPRSFVDEPMRYVSGVRSLATDDDLRHTIVNGLIGVSMPNHRNLSATEIESIVRQVRRFQQAGLTARFEKSHYKDSPQIRDRWIDERFKDTQSIKIDEPQSTGETEFASGRRLFLEIGCVKCHPLETNLETVTAQFDSLGRQVQPRRFGLEPLKRNGSFRELYARIVLGIPGTSHPALSPINRKADLEHLVLYVQSIQGTPRDFKNVKDSTNYGRFLKNETTPQFNP
jgi:cytochrome c553